MVVLSTEYVNKRARDKVSEQMSKGYVRRTPKWAKVFTGAPPGRARRKWTCVIFRNRPQRAGTHQYTNVGDPVDPGFGPKGEPALAA